MEFCDGTNFLAPIGLTILMWRRLELSYTFLSRGEGNARV